MKAFLIKVEITEGLNTGHTYYMYKGQYVVAEGGIYWADMCYKTYKGAKAAATRLFNINERNRNYEYECERLKALQGKADKGYRIYERCIYTPVQVDAV